MFENSFRMDFCSEFTQNAPKARSVRDRRKTNLLTNNVRDIQGRPLQDLIRVQKVIVAVAIAMVGCSEISEWKRQDALLKEMVKTHAPESQVYQHIPVKWVVYDKKTEAGETFGNSLMSYTSADLQTAKEGWRMCDRALWHTTESMVTIVFLKKNIVVQYYIGSQ